MNFLLSLRKDRLTPSVALLCSFLVLTVVSSSRAQTMFTHDANGNRLSQEFVTASTAPTILFQPTTQLAAQGATARFSVMAGGPGPFTYQWFKDANPIAGATDDTLVFASAQTGDFTPGSTGTPKYSVKVTNAYGTTPSNAVALYKDSLGQGLPDWWRLQYFNTSGSVDPLADADGDGVSNIQEFRDGTAANAVSSHLGRLTLIGPPGLVSAQPFQPTYAEGAVVTAAATSAGELQFGGWTGTFRSSTNPFAFSFGSGANFVGNIILTGLFGAMPPEATSSSPLFTNSDSSQAQVRGFAAAPDGTTIAFGVFDRVNGSTRPFVARLLPGGALDSGFVPEPDGSVTGAVILPDGRIVIAGDFANVNGQVRPGVARFNANGRLDNTFLPADQGTNRSQIDTLAVQRDGKILLGGAVWSSAGFRPLLRLNPDGSEDAAFTTSLDGLPSTLTLQPDGKILLGGNFSQVNGAAAPKFVRLKTNGALDPTFSGSVPNGVATAPVAALMQPDGRILVGGSILINLNGSNVTLPVVRLNADGTLDTGFTQRVSTIAPNLSFTSLALQDDGRIVGVGAFILSSPSLVNAIRLNSDGSPDPTCFAISRPNAGVNAVATQTDGSIVLGGVFNDIATGKGPSNGHIYQVTSAPMGWLAAEAEAVALGGHLIAINSQAEQDFVMNTILPAANLSNRPVWIGFTEQGVQGIFAWTTGEPVSFTNWHPGEPTNFTNDEDYGAINWFQAYNGTAPGSWVDVREPGTTGDGGNTNGPYYGIIEIDPAASTNTSVNWIAGRDLIANERPDGAQELTNPNATVPEWSYGTRSTLTSATRELALYAPNEHANSLQGNEALEGWWRQPGFALILVNTGPTTVSTDIQPSEILLHPPPTGFTVLRWTASANGTFGVSAFWQDSDPSGGNGASAHMLKNGTEVLFSKDFDNRDGAFTHQTMALNQGDVIEFVLGGRGDSGYDSTRFNAFIKQTSSNPAPIWISGRDLVANEKPDGHPNETTNPNPTVPEWSYGLRSTLISSDLICFSGAPSHYNTFSGTTTDDDVEGWVAGAGVGANTGTAPVVYNFGFGPNLPVNPGEMEIFPGSHAGPYPVVRWTAPAAGTYDIFAVWQDLDFHGGNGFTAHIVVNGGQVYGQDVNNGSGSSTAQSLNLQQGDRVDFIIGTRGDFSFDVTKFNVAIFGPEVAARPGATDSVPFNPSNAWSDGQGNAITLNSGQGPGDLRNMFSGNYGSPEAGTAFFSDQQGPSFVHFVEFARPTSVNLTGYRLVLGDDTSNGNRGVTAFRLYAFDLPSNAFQLIDTFTPASHPYDTNPPGGINFLDVTRNLAPVTAKRFRAEFVQWGSGANNGPRVIELEAISPQPLSSVASFARLVTTNHLLPGTLSASPTGPIYPANAAVVLNLSPQAPGVPITYTVLEFSNDGVNFQTFDYGNANTDGTWTFPVAALPPGRTFYRALVLNSNLEYARSYAVGPLTTPPVVTSPLTASGSVGIPFSYPATATGLLTAFTATGLPAWATGLYDANTGILTISGTPTVPAVHSVTLQPSNAAGSSPTALSLTVFNSFSNWRTTNFTETELQNPTISGPLGDATGAGIVNLIRYALGIPARQTSRAGLPTASLQQVGASRYLTLTYNRDKLAAGVALAVQVSGNLAGWNSGSAYTTEVSRTTNPDGSETVVTRDNVPTSGMARRFIRLDVAL